MFIVNHKENIDKKNPPVKRKGEKQKTPLDEVGLIYL